MGIPQAECESIGGIRCRRLVRANEQQTRPIAVAVRVSDRTCDRKDKIASQAWKTARAEVCWRDHKTDAQRRNSVGCPGYNQRISHGIWDLGDP
jgi:hypothetical protein